jgi:hypothetical protein
MHGRSLGWNFTEAGCLGAQAPETMDLFSFFMFVKILMYCNIEKNLGPALEWTAFFKQINIQWQCRYITMSSYQLSQSMTLLFPRKYCC